MADPDQVLSSTDEKANFQRLTRLLISGGTRLLREIFDKCCPPSALPGKLSDPSIKRELRRNLTRPERDILYPSPGVYGKSRGCDVTLLFRLLRKQEISGLTPPPGGWDEPPARGDHTLTADLVRIKYYRNSLYAHVKETMDIKDDEFQSIWSEIRDAFVRIAGNLSSVKENEWQGAIDTFLTSPLTPEDKRNADELKEWYLQDKEIKESIEELKSSIKNVERSVSQLEKLIQEKLSSTATSTESQSGRATRLRLHIDFETLPGSGSQCGETEVEVRQLETQDLIQRTQRDVTTCSVRAIEYAGNGMEVRQLETQDVTQHTQRDVTTCRARAIENPGNSGSSSENLIALIGSRYVNTINPSSRNEFHDLLQYLEDIHKVVVVNCHLGSLVLTVECNSLEILDKLWEDYRSGHLGKVVQKCLVSDDILNILGPTEVKVTTSINEEEYKACRQHFLNYQDAGNTDVEYDITEPVCKRRKPDTTEDQGNSTESTESQDQGKHSILSSKQSTKILQSFGRTSVAGKSPLSSRKEEGSATGEKGRQATIRSPRKERGKALDGTFDCQIVFALDYSWSVNEEDFEKEIDFVRHMNTSFNRENNIEAVVYGNGSEIVSFNAVPGTFSGEFKGSRNKAWRQSKGRRMDLALTKAADCFTPSADEHLVILITAGRQVSGEESKEDDQDLVSATEELSSKNIKVILVPVGKETDFRELGLIVKRPQYLFPLSSFDDMTSQKASDIASYITKTVDLESYVKRRVQQFTIIPEKLSLWEKSSLCSDVLEGAWYELYDNQAGTNKIKMVIRESIDNFQSTLVTESKVCITLAVLGPLGVGKSFFLNSLLNLGLKDEVKMKDGPLPSAPDDSQTPLPIYVKFASNVQVLFYKQEADPNPVEWFPEEKMAKDSLARVNSTILKRFQDKESLDSTGYVVLQGPFRVFTEMKTRAMTGEELHLELDVDVEFVDVPGLGDDTGNEAISGALSKADVILFFGSSQSRRPVSAEDIAQVFRRRDRKFEFVSRPKIVHIFNDRNPCPPPLHEFDDLCKEKKKKLDKAWCNFLSSVREVDGIYQEARKKLPKLNSEDILDKLSKESECIYFHAESTDFLTSLKSVVHNHVYDVKIKQTIHPFLQRVHWAAKILRKRVDTTTKKGNIVGIDEGQVFFEMLCRVYEDEESELIMSFMNKALPLESDIKSLHEFLYSKFLLSLKTRQFLAKVLKKSLESYASRLKNKAFHNSNLGSPEDAPKDILELTEIACIARVEHFCENVAPTYLLGFLKKRKKQISLQKDDTLDWKPDACVESKSDLVERYLHLLLKKAAESLEDDRLRKPKQASRPPYFQLMKTLEDLVVKLVPASSFEDACKTVFLNSLKDKLPKVIEFCNDTIRKINPHPKLDVRAVPSLPEKMTNAKEDDKIPQSSHDKIISEVTRILLNPDKKEKKKKKKKDILSEMETKLKFKPGYLKRQQPQNADQRLWALGLVHVLSDKEHFDILLPPEIPLDPTADKALTNVAREILFAHQKSSIFCKIVKTGDEQFQPDREDEIHLKIDAPKKCLEALVSSRMHNTLKAIRAQFEDPAQQVAPIFIPITRPGPDILGNYFLDEDPWRNSSPVDEESGQKDGEARGDSTQGNALKLNIFLVVEPNHLEKLKSTVKDLRYPREHDVQLIYIVLPQKGRGIGVTRSVIKILAECFTFSLYWTIDDNVQTMFRFVQDDHRWYKCPLTSGLLFGQRVFQGCLEKSVKHLSDDEIDELFKNTVEVWDDWVKHSKPGKIARKLLYNEKSLAEVQRNRSRLHLPFADISEICRGDRDKEAKLKAYEREFVAICKKWLFEDTINHIAGVSLADEKSKGSDFMSRYPKADYMRSETLSQVVLNNGDALKAKNFVSDEVILHDEELQIYDEEKCNDPYWGIKGSETSFRRALLVSGVVGYRVIRVVYKCKKLRNAFDEEISERKAQRLGRSKDVDVNEDVDMGD